MERLFQELTDYRFVFPYVVSGKKKRNLAASLQGSYPDHISILVELAGEHLTLDLSRNTILLPRGFQVSHYDSNGSLVTEQEKEPTQCYYEGSVRGFSGSEVSASTCSGLSAVIVLGNRTYVIEHLGEPEHERHLLYRPEDLKSVPGRCGVTNMSPVSALAQDLQHLHRMKKMDLMEETKYVELVLVADSSEYQVFGKSKEAVVKRMLNIANTVDVYYRPFNIRIALIGVEVWTQDQITVDRDPHKTLPRFLDWRKNKLLPRKYNDNAQLIMADVTSDCPRKVCPERVVPNTLLRVCPRLPMAVRVPPVRAATPPCPETSIGGVEPPVCVVAWVSGLASAVRLLHMDGLGDHTPSELMNDMLALMNGHKPCLLFEQLFLEQMPEDIHLLLASEDFSDPCRVMAKADVLWQSKQHRAASIVLATIAHPKAQALQLKPSMFDGGRPMGEKDESSEQCGTSFSKGIAGLAQLDTMCLARGSGGVNQDLDTNILEVSATMAHELGHNLGLTHDTLERKCVCPPGEYGCIMDEALGLVPPTKFSSCSRDDLRRSLLNGIAFCLFNMPKMEQLVGGPKCGNKFVEKDEQCDCGKPKECSDPCCEPATCRLRHGAKCSSAGACCKKCQFLPAGTVCRPKRGECDLPEFCTGQSQDCPNNQYLKDGHTCSKGNLYCSQGTCQSADQQCQDIWGPDARSAAKACYEVINQQGNAFGNCGEDKDHGYKICQYGYVCNKSQLCLGMNTVEKSNVIARADLWSQEEEQ
ncbi:disintegrin and metalloproteinase domain-containing protein 12-like [Hemitrygon akajei]|uniref:disintegrin and metalloproteinase domain-containing protein 12-like n=1 Tax=Hemitrygon akajei TaxID=2704970 RepID=UPI003BFA1C3B